MIDPISLLLSFSYGMTPSITRICRLKLRPNFELFFVSAIILLAIVIATKAFIPLLQTAKMTQALGHASMIRMDGILHYAQHGTWPKNNAASLSSGWHKDYQGDGTTYIQEAKVVDGSVDVYFRNELSGKVLTIRHALSGEEAVAAIWVCGNQRYDNGWIMIGEDRTTFGPEEINQRLR